MTESISIFGLLCHHDDDLARLIMGAGKYLADDPNTAMLKMRQFAEYLAKKVSGTITLAETEDYFDYIRRLNREKIIPYEVYQRLDEIRHIGNKASHQLYDDSDDAQKLLEHCRQIAIWYITENIKHPKYFSEEIPAGQEIGISYYSSIIANDPGNANAFYYRFLLFYKTGNHLAALNDISKAIELVPNFSLFVYLRGCLYHYQKKFSDALTDYLKAIEIKPSEYDYYSAIVDLIRYNFANMLGDALSYTEKMIELAPNDFDAYLANLCLSKQLEKQFSANILERAKRLIPEDDYYNRACLESVIGNIDAAFEYLERATCDPDFNSDWAWEDPDLQWIRTDPRFTEIVGERE